MKEQSDTAGGDKPEISASGSNTPRPRKEVVIIGGGIGGCMSALKAAEDGWAVTIIERSSDLLLGSSNQTTGRMGLGFHYSDVETAKKLLTATINFVKAFPGYEKGKGKSAKDPIKHGRYYVVPDSLISPETITDTYFYLADFYRKLVKNNKDNAVYGDPLKFLKVLGEEKYSEIIRTDMVQKAYETCEPLLDWERFRDDFLSKLKENARIKVILNATVTTAEYLDNGGYKLSFTENLSSTAVRKSDSITTHYVINSTWENTESLDVQLGFVSADDLQRVNRLKVIATVHLPENLTNMHSSFFLTGPHCMVTNNGDGTADMSYAKVTNACNFQGLTIDSTWARLLEGKYDFLDINVVMPDIQHYIRRKSIVLSPDFKRALKKLFNENEGKLPEEKPLDDLIGDYCQDSVARKKLRSDAQDYLSLLSIKIPKELKTYLQTPSAQWNNKILLNLYFGGRIRDGVAHYVPKMATAAVTNVKFGVVKIRGDNVDINDPNSDIHKRDYSGVVPHRIGWITNACMKLLFCVDNAGETLELLNHHFRIDQEILTRAYRTFQRFQHDFATMQLKIDTVRFNDRLHTFPAIANASPTNPRMAMLDNDDKSYNSRASSDLTSSSGSNPTSASNSRPQSYSASPRTASQVPSPRTVPTVPSPSAVPRVFCSSDKSLLQKSPRLSTSPIDVTPNHAHPKKSSDLRLKVLSKSYPPTTSMKPVWEKSPSATSKKALSSSAFFEKASGNASNSDHSKKQGEQSAQFVSPPADGPVSSHSALEL